MHADFDRRSVLGLVPRFILHAITWTLLGLTLQELLPLAWLIPALPIAFGLGIFLVFFRVRVVPAFLAVAVFPWLIRGVLLSLASFSGSMVPVLFDNAWYLTAPLWYASAVFAYLSLRFPRLTVLEILVLVVTSGIILVRQDAWELNVPLPVQNTLHFAAAVFLLIFAAIVLGMSQWIINGRVSGISKHKNADSRGTFASPSVYAVILATALILLLLTGNRIRRDQSIVSGGGVLESDLFRFDFSEVLSLEPEISLNSELTMIYREDGPVVPRYLRRFTLSGWDEEQGFFHDAEREIDFPGRGPVSPSLPKGPRNWPQGEFQSRVHIHQEYYLIALDPQSFFALNHPVSVEPWVIWDDASFTRAYGASSWVSVAGPWELMEIEIDTMDHQWKNYLITGGEDPEYLKLVNEVMGDAQGPWAQAEAIENWFHREFYYSLRPGLAPDGDQLSWFLQETRRGYCSYFAFAMTRMCRAAGIPARVAVGFLTDPETATLGFVPVRADQAHAWVEVWLEDYGWIIFDPTSSIVAPGEEAPIQFISPEEWLPLIEEVLTRRGEISVTLEDDGKEADETSSWWHAAWHLMEGSLILPGILLALLIVLAYMGRIVPGALRLRLAVSRDAGNRTKGRWRLFAGRLIRSGYRPRSDETPLEWAETLEARGLKGFRNWTVLYLKAEYAKDFNDSDEVLASNAAEEVMQAWRKNPGGRLRAAFGLGWRGRVPW